MGFVYKKKSGNVGLKGGEEGESKGSLGWGSLVGGILAF